MCRKLLLLTLFVSALGLVGVSTAYGGLVHVQVADGNDDAEEHVDGSIDLTSSDLENVYEGDASPDREQVVGIRFQNVQIPKGEVITRAYVRFDADDVDNSYHAGTVNALIQGQLDPNPAGFENVANNVSSRPRTAATVPWSPEVWTEPTHLKWFTSDIASVIQELVDQDGWAAGNSLVILISQDPDNPSTGCREAESFDGAGGNEDRRPVLIVEYGTVPGATEDIFKEAEDADVLGSSWRVYEDGNSSGSKHIGSEDGDGNNNNSAPGADWVAAYDFYAQGGVYKVLLLGQEVGSDSFWVRITGATGQSYEHPDQAGTGWVKYNGFDADDGVMAWDEVHSDDNDKDIVYWDLPAGPHTIEVAKREDGVWFDSLIVTNDLNLQQVAIPRLAGSAALDIRVAATNDDAEQHVWPESGGSMESMTSSDLEIPYEDPGTPPGDPQDVGMRFTGILVPNGGVVYGAYVEFEVDELQNPGAEAPVNVIIEGELSPNAAAFENVANNITDRPTTVAKVKWSLPAGLAVNDKVRTPDISSIIREIATQPGWGIGNALVLIVRDDPDNPSEGLRTFESYDGESQNAPLLHLTTKIPLAKDPSPADGAVGLSIDPVLSSFFSHDVPKNVPQAKGNLPQGVNSKLTVGDSITIKDLNVEVDIRMPGNNADLNVYLTSPDGKKIDLFSDIGSNLDDFKNTILDDEAPTSIKNGSGNFRGIFRPEQSLSAYDGRNSAGDWTLRVEDDWHTGKTGAGPTATLNSWRIVVQNPIYISWTPAAGAAAQDVYFSENFDDVNGIGDAGLVANVAGNLARYDIGELELGTTYYWRIDAVDADGLIQKTGNIWSFSTAAGNVVVNQRISNGNDDVEERLRPDRNGDLDMGSSDFEFPYEDFNPLDDLQRPAMRFVNVGIPQGSQIAKSYIEFVVDGSAPRDNGTEAVNVLIDAQLTGDAEPFVDEPFNISNRSFTTTVVPWSPEPWPTAGQIKQTPDISVLVQELVSLDDWASGNAMAFTIQDDPCNPSVGIRATETYNASASLAPLLYVAAITESAGNPSPANGDIDVVQNTMLHWSRGFSGVSRDVFFGTNPNPPKLDQTTGTSYDVGKLAVSTTYYWKVDEYAADGSKHRGTVWSFTTIIGEATNPSPADHAAGVPLDTVLSWTPGATAASSDVYFGMDGALAFMGNQAENSFDPGGLDMGASYSWRIDSIEADGTKHVGDVWTFKAPREGYGTILREVWEGISGTAVANLTGNAAYPGNPTYSDEVTSFETPTDFADNFGSRVHGWLHPVTSGDYLFWISSDDNSELWLSTDESPANASVIAKVTAWTSSRDFDDPDAVPSGPIHLEGGQAYYISALYKEGGGGDNLAVAWQGPDSPARSVISGYYLTPFVNYWVSNPSPADGATVTATSIIVSWNPAATAVSYDGYIGTAPDALEYQGSLAETTVVIGAPGAPVPNGLAYGTTYYWRIDAVEADPNVVYQGPVWSFTVPPETAYNPSPADAAQNVATNVTLSWTPGLGGLLHMVYFGDDLDTVTNAAGAPPLPMTTYNPGPLQAGKTYYWRVDEFKPPSTIRGNVWSFTTAQ